jgi:hypothetical protein
MSTGLECNYVEAKPNKWYWLLATSKDGWSWLDDATVVGPFPTQEDAYDHLHSHEANPGGYCRFRYPAIDTKLGKTYKEAIARAQTPRQYNGW